MLQAKWTPGKLLGIFRPRHVTSGFQFVKVITDLSNRGIFGEQTADYVVEICFFFCCFDVVFLWFTFTCLAYFPGRKIEQYRAWKLLYSNPGACCEWGLIFTLHDSFLPFDYARLICLFIANLRLWFILFIICYTNIFISFLLVWFFFFDFSISKLSTTINGQSPVNPYVVRKYQPGSEEGDVPHLTPPQPIINWSFSHYLQKCRSSPPSHFSGPHFKQGAPAFFSWPNTNLNQTAKNVFKLRLGYPKRHPEKENSVPFKRLYGCLISSGVVP